MWRCPNCKSEIRIFRATTTILVYEDGCERDDGFEWDDNNEAECTSCDWSGTVGDTKDDSDED